MVLLIAAPARAQTQADPTASMTQASEQHEDPAEVVREFVRGHETELLAGTAVAGGIAFISALILIFTVRHLKQRDKANPALRARDGVQQQPPASPSGPAREVLRGAKAFPRGTAERLGKPARSGDTTPLVAGATLEFQETGASAPASARAPEHPPGSIWTVLAAWTFLGAGLAFLARDPRGYTVCVPFLMIGFLLAIMAMMQCRIVHGSLVLAALYLGAPAVWLARPPQPGATTGETAATKATPGDSSSLQQVATVKSHAHLSSEPQAIETTTPPPPPEGRPQMPRLLVPEDDALPLPVSATVPSPPPAPAIDLPPMPAKASDALFSYRARLSHADHLNQHGIDLRTLARTKFNEILLQERLHVHQNSRRDPEDSVDEEFKNRPLEEYRSLLEGKPLRMPSSVTLIQLLQDDVIVDVQVFDKFIQVDPVAPLANP